MLLDFENELGFDTKKIVVELEGVVDIGKLVSFGEVGIDNGADDLDDGSLIGHKSGWWLV